MKVSEKNEKKLPHQPPFMQVPSSHPPPLSPSFPPPPFHSNYTPLTPPSTPNPPTPRQTPAKHQQNPQISPYYPQQKSKPSHPTNLTIKPSNPPKSPSHHKLMVHLHSILVVPRARISIPIGRLLLNGVI